MAHDTDSLATGPPAWMMPALRGVGAAMNILLVEDDPADVLLTREALAGAGSFRVVQVDRLEQALRRLDDGVFDAVLLDLGLPDSNGLGAFGQIHGLRRDLPVVVLTGQDDEELGLAAVQAGAQDYLVKGKCSDRELQRTLRYAIERTRLEREKRSAEQTLRRSAEVQHGMLNSLPAHIALLDRNGRILVVNEAWKMFALRARYASCGLGANYLFVCDAARGDGADEAAAVAAGLRGVLSGELPEFSAEYACHAPDRKRWFRMTATPVHEQGEAAGAVVMHVDITSRKIDEIERRSAEESLRLSEERFRLLAKATTDVLWDWDLTTDSLWWSEGIRERLGYEPGELVHGLDAWAAHVHDEDRASVLASLQRVVDGGANSWISEYRFRRSDGSWVPILDRGHLVRDRDGKAVRMVGGMTDLSEKKDLETRLLQSQKLEAIGSLAGGIAHDFNNLLTVINGNANLLLSRLAADDAARPLLSDIRSAGDRAARLTRQLLAFSRKQVMAPQLLDLNQSVRSAAKMLRRLIGEHIEISLELDEDIPAIRVDPGQLEQILLNLSVNARDAMRDGGRLRIATSRCPAATDAVAGNLGSVRLDVTDTGCGIPDDVLPRIFEPFFTTKTSGAGTGLGLSTVFGIVSQSGGSIDVESSVGCGTSFRISFPGVAAAAKPAVAQEDALPHGSETVLVVEDEDGVRSVIERTLRSLGYEVLTASGGERALELFEGHAGRVALVLTDVVMPGMHGRELAQRLHARDGGLRVLYMSGYMDDEALRLGLHESTDRLLQKPFSLATLAGTVRDVLDGR